MMEAAAGWMYFNPRSSCEERLPHRTQESRSTISIHAPHARSDVRRPDLPLATR